MCWSTYCRTEKVCNAMSYRQINCPLPEGLALKSLGLMNVITDGCKQWHYKEDNSVRM